MDNQDTPNKGAGDVAQAEQLAAQQECPETFGPDAAALANALHQTSHVLGNILKEKRGYDAANVHCLLSAAAARAVVMAVICGAKKGEERFILDHTIELIQEIFGQEMALHDAAAVPGTFVSSEVGHA